MKKIFDAEYGDELAKKVGDWIIKQTLTEDGSCKVFRPIASITLYDQRGDDLKEEEEKK